MDKDWQAVADAINTRMAELGLSQLELATRSRVSVATIRQVQQAEVKRRSPRTLADLSAALGWPSRHLEQVAEGAAVADVIPDRFGALEIEVAELRRRVDALEHRDQ